MNYDKALRIVLDFVERWNKQDREEDVAEASEILKELILTCPHVCTSNCRKNGCNCDCGEWHDKQQEQFRKIIR